MPTIADPYPALISFQKALDDGVISVAPSRETAGIHTHTDNPTGTEPRLTFVHMVGDTVTALVMMVHAEPYQGLPCYTVGYAVPPEYRRQGRAKALLALVVQDMTVMFGRPGYPKSFYLEAVVSQSNLVSQKVAEHVLGPKIDTGFDEASGEPIFQYMLRVDVPSP